jgi:hypothetical protein
LSSLEKFKTRRSKKDSVLSKHKKWLQDLQKTKDRLESEFLEDMMRKEEAQKKFQENERKLRVDAVAQMRSELKENDSQTQHENNSSSSSINSENAGASGKPQSMDDKVAALLEKARQEVARLDFKSQPKENSSSNGGASNNQSKVSEKKKPAWAMAKDNSDKAGESSDDELLEDSEGLLSFAENLDYAKTIINIETQMVMEKLKSRINEIEKEMDNDEKQEKAVELRNAKREMLALMGQAVSGLTTNASADGNKNEDMVALMTAKAVLESAEELQAIHSAKSVASMIKSAKDKEKDSKVVGGYGGVGPVVLNEPRIVVHEPNEGARAESKGASNLPYLHRNPAV